MYNCVLSEYNNAFRFLLFLNKKINKYSEL